MNVLHCDLQRHGTEGLENQMRKIIATMLFGGGALTIKSFGDGIAEKILLAGCIVCVCIASGLEFTGD